MLLRIVRPMRRKGSSAYQFVQRIPADVKSAVVGLKLSLPLADKIIPKTISPRAKDIRLSLRTRDPSEAKLREIAIVAYLEKVWQAVRQSEKAISLSSKQAHALAGKLYRSWANEDNDQTIAIEHNPITREWERSFEEPDERSAIWDAVSKLELDEKALGQLIDRLLLAEGIASTQIDPQSRQELLSAFRMALLDAFANRKRQAEGDYSPDPKSERFPVWTPPHTDSETIHKKSSKSSCTSPTALVESWWPEAKATGRSISTYESYRNTFLKFEAFLKKNKKPGAKDCRHVSKEDVIAFKNYRLTQVSKRTGKPISARTVKDSDLAALKSVFGWAVSNDHMEINPAEGVTVPQIAKKQRNRTSNGFEPNEARTVLTHARAYVKNTRENFKTYAVKRWAPCLCAYTGARLGEIVQLRNQDIRSHDDGAWFSIIITPEAGPVKTKEAREVPLHDHLIELGFIEFANKQSPTKEGGYLFITPDAKGETRGLWRAAKNRVAKFVREVITDPEVAPNHAWRHLFKTIAFEANIQERVIDAICGHAPRTVGERYGEISLKAKRDAILKFPRFEISKRDAASKGEH